MNFKRILKKIIIEEVISTKQFDKSWFNTFLLCLFFGFLGAHRFYTGRKKSAIVYFFTLGLIFIGVFWDLLSLFTGGYYDSEGKVVGNFD